MSAGWTAALQALSAIGSLAVLIAIGLAAFGSYKWRALEDLEKVAEARGERIEMLEADLASVKTTHAADMISLVARHDHEVEFLRAAVGALEAQVAEMQKLRTDVLDINLKLQRQLETMSRRAQRAKQNGEPKP